MGLRAIASRHLPKSASRTPLTLCQNNQHILTSGFCPKREISNSARSQKPVLTFSAPRTHLPLDLTAGDGILRMLIFGKPGAGKGTLSARLVRKYDILSLSVGDLLRQHIVERTEIGRQAEGIVAHGGLVPDDVMLKVVTSKLDVVRNKHWILDGFPRTLGQGEMLEKYLTKSKSPLSLVVNLDVPDEVILSRISDRWVHLPSGRVYNLSYNRPRVEGCDDETGEPLTKRPDDNPEIFSRRLRQFYASTSPLLKYYGSKMSSAGSKLVTLKGITSDEIWPKLDAVVSETFPTLRERSQLRMSQTLNAALIAEEKQGTNQRTV